MHIRNYQIHNILKAYQKQLAQGRKNAEQKKDYKVQYSLYCVYSDGNRKSIINKITLNILKKINLLETGSKSTKKMVDMQHNSFLQDRSHDHKIHNFFSFNIIDQNNQKIENSIKVDKSNSLISYKDSLFRRKDENINYLK